MENIICKKPCVVSTPQGFSVSYNNHLLYSKYNPSKLIKQTVEGISILSGSIILCISPVLEYGLEELIKKLPENCILIICEKEKYLYNFLVSRLSNLQYIQEQLNSKKLLFISPEELDNLPVTLYNLTSRSFFKRAIRIDFSAAIQLHKEYYHSLENACINAVATFWKNRVTLTKFGRRYSHNLFSNLHNIGASTPISNFFNSISKPIIVFGAGQSVDRFFYNNKLNDSDFYILCADTALHPLLKRNIIPDGVFLEEAQSVISKSFIGAINKTHLFAGLSSIPSASRYFDTKNISYFTTEYTDACFIDNLKEEGFLPPVNSPFGSVGITAVYYALAFRKNDSIPVYFCGLDFSYGLGQTHANNTLAHISRLLSSSRITTVENYDSFFTASAIPIADKNNNSFVTTPTLKSYADLFSNLFLSTPNLYDAGECGYPLGFPFAKPQKLNGGTTEIKAAVYSKETCSAIQKYLSKERKELEQLKNLLTGNTSLSGEELKEEIKKIAAEKEYLYLHFPDGYCFNYNQSFLNRIRTEIDFFLKWIY